MPTALITGVGTTKSIGAGIAQRLAEAGWDLALTHWSPYDRRLEREMSAGQNLHSILQQSGVRISRSEFDLESSSAVEDLFAWLGGELGRADALILSHCESVPSGIMDTSLESVDRHFAVNVRASWQLIKRFASQVPDSGGSIVALTSDHTVGNVPYGASKAALDRIVLSCARELSHLNIRANVINPGPVDTGWMTDRVRDDLKQRQPTGELGTPRNCGGLVAFLLSPEGSWINGQLLKSDGGFSA